ncbi:Uncharacterized protein PBTT_09469 [Plasmodiophora brassicae]
MLSPRVVVAICLCCTLQASLTNISRGIQEVHNLMTQSSSSPRDFTEVDRRKLSDIEHQLQSELQDARHLAAEDVKQLPPIASHLAMINALRAGVGNMTQMVETVCEAAVVHCDALDGNGLFKLTFAAGSLSPCPSHLVETFAWAYSRLSGQNGKALSDMVLVMAKCNVRNRPLLGRYARSIVEQDHSLTSYDVTNVVDALAKLRFADIELFLQLSQRAIGIMDTFSARDVARVAGAFATVDIFSFELLHQVSHRAIQVMDDMAAWDIAKLARAFATFNIADHDLFQHLLDRAAAIADTFKPHDIAEMKWALDTLHISVTGCGLFLDLLSGRGAPRGDVFDKRP